MIKNKILIIVFGFLLAMPVYQFANAQVEENTSGPAIYNSGMILTNMGDIDEKHGQYWMDFILFIESEDVDFTKEIPQLSFVNGRDLTLSDELIEPNYYEVRVQGEFFNVFDYELFPFQTIELKIVIEPKIPGDINAVKFSVLDDNPIDPSVAIHGWEIKESKLFSHDHTYPDGLQFSRLVAEFRLTHQPLGVALSTILPVTIITSIAMFVFFIPHNFTPRIYLTAPLLLTVVYWHQSNLAHLPTLGYLTLFDKLLLIYYSLFVNAILSVCLQMRVHATHDDDVKVRKINRLHAILTPIIFVIGIILLWDMYLSYEGWSYARWDSIREIP